MTARRRPYIHWMDKLSYTSSCAVHNTLLPLPCGLHLAFTSPIPDTRSAHRDDDAARQGTTILHRMGLPRGSLVRPVVPRGILVLLEVGLQILPEVVDRQGSRDHLGSSSRLDRRDTLSSVRQKYNQGNQVRRKVARESRTRVCTQRALARSGRMTRHCQAEVHLAACSCSHHRPGSCSSLVVVAHSGAHSPATQMIRHHSTRSPRPAHPYRVRWA